MSIYLEWKRRGKWWLVVGNDYERVYNIVLLPDCPMPFCKDAGPPPETCEFCGGDGYVSWQRWLWWRYWLPILEWWHSDPHGPGWRWHWWVWEPHQRYINTLHDERHT